MKDTGEQTRRLQRQADAGLHEGDTPTPPAPTVWTGRYSYIAPDIGNAPNPGEIVHADNLTSQMLFALTDLDGLTYSGSPLAIGDDLVIGGTRYELVAAPRDQGAYISVYIEPQIQKQPAIYTVVVHAAGNA